MNTRELNKELDRAVIMAPKMAEALQQVIDITRDNLVITPPIAGRIQRIARAALAEYEASHA